MVAIEYEISEKQARTLPKPDLLREQCVKECMGCNKMFSSMKMKADGSDVIGDVCIAYINPKKIQRRGCGLQSNRLVNKEEKKKWVNPIKYSKRRNR